MAQTDTEPEDTIQPYAWHILGGIVQPAFALDDPDLTSEDSHGTPDPAGIDEENRPTLA